jgi:hypothetical protein
MRILNASPIDHPECRPDGCEHRHIGPCGELDGLAAHLSGAVADVALVPPWQIAAVDALGLPVGRVLGVRLVKGGAVEFVDRAGNTAFLDASPKRTRKPKAEAE